MAQAWDVKVAGEPEVIGVVYAPDEATARARGGELLEERRERLGLAAEALRAEWVQVVPSTDPSARVDG